LNAAGITSAGNPGSSSRFLVRGQPSSRAIIKEVNIYDSFRILVIRAYFFLTGLLAMDIGLARLAEAQPDRGELGGKVIAADTGEPVADALIRVENTGQSTQSDETGNFRLKLPSGKYTITVRHPDFNEEILSEVEVTLEKTAFREVALELFQMLEIDEMKITATHMKGSIPAFLEEERASPDVVDAISAEQMSRAGDTYVAEALKRVPGLTLVDDKFVYVKGLGERYSSVLLNGAKLSSTNPTRRVVELDFIPGEILEGIVVQKSYSPDLPSDFGGGTILLRPRSYPEEFFFNLSTSGKYQLDTTLKEGKAYKGGDLDFLGFDDGARDLPGRVPSRQAFGEMTPEQREAAGESFPQIYDMDDETFPPDVDLPLAAGNRHRPGSGENTFGYLAALRYSQSWDILDQDWRTFNRGGNVINDWGLEWNDQNINTGAFLNLGASLGKNHRLSSTTMVLRDTLKSVHIRQGYFSDWDHDVVNTELGWLERQLLTQQLSGEHDFPALANLNFDWQYTYSLGDRQEPDLRNYT